MKKFGYFLLLLAIIIAGVFIFGPREPADTTITFDESVIGDDLVAPRDDRDFRLFHPRRRADLSARRAVFGRLRVKHLGADYFHHPQTRARRDVTRHARGRIRTCVVIFFGVFL